MPNDVNFVVVTGRLTREVEKKYVNNGTAVARLSVANNEAFFKDKQKQEHVNFFDVVVWGAHAEACSMYLKKGNSVVVTGKIKQSRWNTQEGARSKIDIVATSVVFTGLPKSQEQTTESNNQHNVDNIPF